MSGEGGIRQFDPMGWVSEHPSVDFGVAAAVLGLHLLLARSGHGDVLAWIETDQRQALYGAGAGVVSIIGGLATVALAMYQAADGRRSRAIRRFYGVPLRKNWRGVLFVTGFAAVLCLVSLSLDRARDPLSARFVFEFAMMLWGVRLVRLIWLFDAFLKVMDTDAMDRPMPPAPGLGPRWTTSAQGRDADKAQ